MTRLSKTTSSFLERAMPFARLGFRVLPSGWAAKEDRHPLVRDWGHAATRNREQIAAWSREFAVLRPAVSILVGDEETWALDADEPEWLGKTLPHTTVVRSGGGGKHLYFKHDRYSRSKLVPLGNVWVKGLKRDKAVELFVRPHALLAPGTVHYRTGQEYAWIRETKPVAAPRNFVDSVAALPWAKSVTPRASEEQLGYWLPEALEACLKTFGAEYREGRREGQFYVPCPFGTHSPGSRPDKTAVFLRNGRPCFYCFGCLDPKRTWGDFARAHDPLRLLFSIDSWLVAETERVRKEFRHGKR